MVRGEGVAPTMFTRRTGFTDQRDTSDSRLTRILRKWSPRQDLHPQPLRFELSASANWATRGTDASLHQKNGAHGRTCTRNIQALDLTPLLIGLHGQKWVG